MVAAADRRAAGLVWADHRAVVVRADAVHPLRCAGGCHAPQERSIVTAGIRAVAAEVARGRHRPADYQDVGVGRLNGDVCLAQHVDVVLRVHLAVAWAAVFTVEIRLVPHLDCVSPHPDEVNQRRCELAMIVEVSRSSAVAHCADQDLQAGCLGRGDSPWDVRILGLELHPGHANVAHLVEHSGAAHVAAQLEGPVAAGARGRGSRCRRRCWRSRRTSKGGVLGEDEGRAVVVEDLKPATIGRARRRLHHVAAPQPAQDRVVQAGAAAHVQEIRGDRDAGAGRRRRRRCRCRRGRRCGRTGLTRAARHSELGKDERLATIVVDPIPSTVSSLGIGHHLLSTGQPTDDRVARAGALPHVEERRGHRQLYASLGTHSLRAERNNDQHRSD
jgi:hypothetical protein